MKSIGKADFRYWVYQISGWGSLAILALIVSHLSGKLDRNVILRVLFTVAIRIGGSHLIKLVIDRFRIFEKPTKIQAMGLLLLSVIFGCLVGVIELQFAMSMGFLVDEEKGLSALALHYRFCIYAIVSYIIWNIVFFMAHYHGKSLRQEDDTIRMGADMKSLELKNLNSYINPHFIFNTLNSIRALIHEDPERASRAVTSLGNMLNGSMRMSQEETVTLGQELDIVRDYLSLQRIRFEERLRVDYDIDQRTLDKPVPIMMLQTLVENAVKHGIGKRIDGGLVRIVSKMNEGELELKVQNTGRLEPERKREGFGWSSTSARLKLIYEDAASFSIRETDEEMVEALVIMSSSKPEKTVLRQGRMQGGSRLFKYRHSENS